MPAALPSFAARPLRIIHVGNFCLTPKGAAFYGVPFKLSNGLIRNGHNVLNVSDRDLARASTPFGSRKLGVRGANRKLITLCDEFAPDLLLLGHADVIQPATIAAIRQRHPCLWVAQWNVDPLFEPDNVRRISSKLAVVDCTFVSTAGPDLAALGADSHRVAFLPNPVDVSIERHRMFVHDRPPQDLFFAVGNGDMPREHAGIRTTPNRLATRIRQELPHLRPAFHGVLGAPPVFGQAYDQALSSSAMGLNLSRRNDVPLYTSDRLAHLVGNGLLAFVDRASGYEAVMGSDGLAFYDTEDDLLAGIAHYLGDTAARRTMAERGWALYHRQFAAERVAAYLLDTLYERLDPLTFAWSM